MLNNATNETTVTKAPGSNSMKSSDVILVVYLFFLVTTALAGNALMWIVVIKKNLIQKVHYYFILSLAASDFLNALFKIPTSILLRFDRNWYPHYGLCYLTTPMGVLFGAASVFSLSVIAVNRFFVISSPLSYMEMMPPAFARIIVAGIWFGAIVLALPPIMWREPSEICRSGAVSKDHYLSELLYFVLGLWLFVIVVPSVVMFVSYLRIYLIARRHSARINLHSQQSDHQTRKRHRDIKAAVVLAVIGGIFIVCWFPFFVVQSVHKFGTKVDPVYFSIFLCVMYSNSALDPVVLFLFNAEIRAAFKKFFCRGCIQVNPGGTEFASMNGHSRTVDQ